MRLEKPHERILRIAALERLPELWSGVAFVRVRAWIPWVIHTYTQIDTVFIHPAVEMYVVHVQAGMAR